MLTKDQAAEHGGVNTETGLTQVTELEPQPAPQPERQLKRPPEGCVHRGELAKQLSCNKKRIAQMMERGLPHVRDDGVAWFSLSEVFSWVRADPQRAQRYGVRV